MDKKIYNISSYKRLDSLLKTIESIYHQSDIINVTLNSYEEIPIDLYDKKINIFIGNNDKGDAYKFYNQKKYDGYYFTIDDDLIYPENYSEYMINKIEEYNRKSIITLHGRNFNQFPIDSYYLSQSELYHFNRKLEKDVNTQFGGTGVMAFHSSLMKIDIEYFRTPNMADIWVGKFAKENNIDIICVEHNNDFVKQQKTNQDIFSNSKKNDSQQTEIVNIAYTKKDISILIATYKNIDYLDECLNSVINSCKEIKNFEILVGIDNCQETLNYIKTRNYVSNVRFLFFLDNVGPYVVKNTLCKISNSEKIIFFDSDDVMKENMVNDCYNLLDSFDLIKPMYHNFNGDLDRNLKKYERNSGLWGEGVFAIKRNIFLFYNGFEDWRCAADSDFMNRLYKNNLNLKMTDNLFFYRRLHSLGLTSNPKTNYQSELRRKYFQMSKEKKDFGPLPELKTCEFVDILEFEVKDNTILTDYSIIQETQQTIKSKQEIILDLLNKPKVVVNTSKPKINEKREMINNFNRFVRLKKGK